MNKIWNIHANHVKQSKNLFALLFSGGIFLKVCLQGQGLWEKTKCFMVDNLMRNNTVQNRVVANFISKAYATKNLTETVVSAASVEGILFP